MSEYDSTYPWYQTLTDEKSLEQGDIIENCKVLLFKPESYEGLLSEGSSIAVDVFSKTFIIMSQSCDLMNDKIDSVIVCPLLSLAELKSNNEYYQSSSGREELRKGNQPAYHLLNNVGLHGADEDFYCVSFYHIYSLPKSYLQKLVGGRERKRLLPPYKEHLSQSFARYFMRVGLPSGICFNEIKNY
ncbi:MAG: hypothetical protein JEY71_15285 [Sphaerochaeta sp.]|nr:hypothetical protein [Sphaerochaeta sp.]